jgi:hypothetical protein
LDVKKPRGGPGGFSGLDPEISHQAFGRRMVVILQPIFVSHDLAIKFIHQLIHRSVEIRMGTLGKYVGALDVNIALRSLPSLLLFLIFHRQQHFDIHDLVKMPCDSIKFARNVAAQGWGDLEMMTADRQIHK